MAVFRLCTYYTGPRIHGMPTDISPVFGITLLEFLNAAIIASIGVAIGIFGSIAANVWLSSMDRKQTKDHIRQTHQVESARLALELLQSWSKTNYPEFGKFIDRLHAPKPIAANDPNIQRFLGELDRGHLLGRKDIVGKPRKGVFLGKSEDREQQQTPQEQDRNKTRGGSVPVQASSEIG